MHLTVKDTIGMAATGCRAVALLVGVAAFSGLMGCSRSEPPKAPAKPEAPAVVPATNAALTGMTQPVSNVAFRVGHAGTNWLDTINEKRKQRGLPPLPESTPESKAALRKRQEEYVKENLPGILAHFQTLYESEARKLEAKELELREKDPAIKEAYAKVLGVGSEYEESCVKSIPGYAEQIKESDALRARMEQLARQGAGQSGAAQDAGEIRKQLNQALANISRMRTEANASDSPVGKTFLKVMAVQADYTQALQKNDEYVQAKTASDEMASRIKDLTSRQ